MAEVEVEQSWWVLRSWWVWRHPAGRDVDFVAVLEVSDLHHHDWSRPVQNDSQHEVLQGESQVAATLTVLQSCLCRYIKKQF